MKNKPNTHDYTDRHWGHDYAVVDVQDGGNVLMLMGWGHGIVDGDYMLIESHSDEPGSRPSTRYRVVGITYFKNPPDMWGARCAFDPRPPTPNTETKT